MNECCKKEIEKILPVYTLIISTMQALLSAYEEFDEVLAKELYEEKKEP
jgi:hypothetical protein